MKIQTIPKYLFVLLSRVSLYCGACWGLFQNIIFSQALDFSETSLSKTTLSENADSPKSFGYKNTWFAIKNESCKKIIKTFGLKDVRKSNWASGMQHIITHKDSDVFITPPVNGWCFVIGNRLLVATEFATDDEAKNSKVAVFFKRLSQEFRTCHYFQTYRVCEAHAWAQIKGGEVKRIFACMDGETIYEEGSLTEEEKKIDFFNHQLSDAENEEDSDMFCSITEDDVIFLSSQWSLNPQTLDQIKNNTGVGYVGKFK